jgi:hypothetical protein
MEMHARSTAAVVLAALALGGCAKHSDSPSSPSTSAKSASANARFVNGPTTAGTSGTARTFAAARSSAQSQSTDTTQNCSAQCWFLSPDQITMTLTGIQPMGSGGGGGPVITVNCSITYDKSKPGLTQLTNCPFTIPTGTYSGMTLYVSSTMHVTIDDAVAGFYSTSSGIVTSPPAGGAQPFSFTIGATNANELQEPMTLPAPLVVADSTPVNFSVIVNGLQSFKVAVTGGTVTLGWPGTSYTDPGRPDWAVASGTLASVAFYASQSLGTAGSFCAGGCVGEPNGIQSVSVYYASPTVPEMVSIPVNGAPKGCGPFGLSWLVDPRSYLGQDAAGNIAWAIPLDASYLTYGVEMQMTQVTTIGGSTTLYCKNITANPAPAGGSFASGAPGIASAANLVGTFILLAH